MMFSKLQMCFDNTLQFYIKNILIIFGNDIHIFSGFLLKKQIFDV